MPFLRSTARYREPCGRASFTASRKKPCPSATSPMVSMCRPGWRRRCRGFTTVISVWDGRARVPGCAPGSPLKTVDDGELWETHLALKTQLIDFVRRRAREQAEYRRESAETLQRLSKVLSPDASTIGFAPRFAT